MFDGFSKIANKKTAWFCSGITSKAIRYRKLRPNRDGRKPRFGFACCARGGQLVNVSRGARELLGLWRMRQAPPDLRRGSGCKRKRCSARPKWIGNRCAPHSVPREVIRTRRGESMKVRLLILAA